MHREVVNAMCQMPMLSPTPGDNVVIPATTGFAFDRFRMNPRLKRRPVSCFFVTAGVTRQAERVVLDASQRRRAPPKTL